MSFLSDIATLAKAGYKIDEIKELMSLQDNANTNLKDEPTSEPTIQENQEEPTFTKEPEKIEEPEIDYKALYEESQKALKQAQQSNIKTNQAGNEEPEEKKIEELFRSFM